MEGTKEICAALRELYPMNFEVWQDLDSDQGLDCLLLDGETLTEAFKRDVTDLMKRSCAVVLDGITGAACNATPKYASELGNQLAVQSGTFGLVYCYEGHRQAWDCSLRSVGDFDVSRIAKLYGGGGHRNAAGFSVPRIYDILDI